MIETQHVIVKTWAFPYGVTICLLLEKVEVDFLGKKNDVVECNILLTSTYKPSIEEKKGKRILLYHYFYNIYLILVFKRCTYFV